MEHDRKVDLKEWRWNKSKVHSKSVGHGQLQVR